MCFKVVNILIMQLFIKMPQALQSSKEGFHALSCGSLHSPQPEGRAECVGAEEEQRQGPELVESHCLPYNNYLYTYLQCALRGLVRAQRAVHLQTVRPSSRAGTSPCGSTAWSLPLTHHERCTSDFSSLVSEGKYLAWPPPLHLSSLLSTCLQYSSAAFAIFLH